MLPPHELNKKKKFPVVLRGYSPSEVDGHIEFLIERYTELYRKNDELEKQIRLLSSKLDELESKEDAINRAIINAQKLKERIISEAEDEARVIKNAAKSSSARIIASFEEKINYEKATLHALMDQVSYFKAEMLSAYEEHMEMLNRIAPEEADPEYDRSDSTYVARIMQDVRAAADGLAEKAIPEQTDEDAFFVSKEEGDFAPIEEAKEPKKLPKRVLRARRTPGFSKITDLPDESKEELPTEEPDESLKELFKEKEEE